MTANYHTHTWRCNHATGTEEEYVRAALSRRFQTLGFTDHTPYFFPEGYYSGFRMRPEQLEDYCNTVRKLQKKYSGQIEIPLGVEIEFYPAYFHELLPVLQDQGIEYMLLGQHFVGNEIGEHYSGKVTGDSGVLKKYVRQVCDAMHTGLFTYLAHPDLIHYVGDDGFYRQQMAQICREAKQCGVPLEINMLGMWSGRNYPDRRFWELAAEEGCIAVIGCDAHAPDHLLKIETEEKARELARSLGLRVMDSVELKMI